MRFWNVISIKTNQILSILCVFSTLLKLNTEIRNAICILYIANNVIRMFYNDM